MELTVVNKKTTFKTAIDGFTLQGDVCYNANGEFERIDNGQVTNAEGMYSGSFGYADNNVHYNLSNINDREQRETIITGIEDFIEKVQED